MNKYNYLLFVFLILLNSSCKKKEQGPGTTTTTIDGRVFTKYTHVPVAGSSLYLQGWKSHEPCLFCPDSTAFTIASTETDANGYYHLVASTTEPVGSTLLWSESYGQYVPKGVSSTNVDFYNKQIMVLKEELHIINNTHPPLFVEVPISSKISIAAADTLITLYGYAWDTGAVTYNFYTYTLNGMDRRGHQQYNIGGYHDTIAYQFTVDASTF